MATTESAAEYRDRRGYDPSFLKPDLLDAQVFLPALSKQLEVLATRLRESPNQYTLAYHGYSLVMHAKRRFAKYSAANVDFAGRMQLTRPADKWMTDPRIPASAQIGAKFYAANQFDRGHLTRREDMEYGTSREEALATAADTCHWTNCTPQHAKFNEGKELWQGIERHLLEDAITDDGFRAQVSTGPVFAESDPVLDGFPASPFPLRYWKVAAAISASGKLFATAYVLDQSAVIQQFGLRAPPEPGIVFRTLRITAPALGGVSANTCHGRRTFQTDASSQTTQAIL